MTGKGHKRTQSCRFIKLAQGWERNWKFTKFIIIWLHMSTSEWLLHFVAVIAYHSGLFYGWLRQNNSRECFNGDDNNKMFKLFRLKLCWSENRDRNDTDLATCELQLYDNFNAQLNYPSHLVRFLPILI